MEDTKIPKTIDEYISGYSQPVQDRLQKIRLLVHNASPEAEEKISYGMPAFTLHGMLLYFAAHTKHIGFYPFTTAIESFRKELSDYKTAKGSIQFPNDKPLPIKLISQIIDFRVVENRLKAEQKASLKKNKKNKL
jgi:uncharacterized protein YdhG (YjbR/CyaY superfamily)